MRIARFAVGSDVAFGVVEGDVDAGTAEIAVLTGHPYGPLEFSGERVRLDRARLLAPVLPSKIMAFAKTYADHAREMGGETPTDPVMFLKPSTSVIGHDDAIVLPPHSTEVHYEAELAVVIGRLCRSVPIERAYDVVLGYTCANDVTARDLQRADGQWGRAKGFDTFCPLGPWIETVVDPSDLALRCRLDGTVVQDARTSQMGFTIPELIAWVSSAMTLLPGDVLLTGTPAGVGPLVHGTTVEVDIDGIGTLRNRVVAA
jgi:2-keto-4-pentenoate hydratase/2-oxohepta-3-ene-1,7-dioic acid hydratase in catechol pathway